MYKAQLLIYLGEISSYRKLATALRYNARLCFLCGLNYMKTPTNRTFTNFRDRLGEDIFYEIRHCLIAQAIALKVIRRGDTATDSTHLLIGLIPRRTDLWQEKYNAPTSVERTCSEEKGSHHLATPRMRGLPRIKIHVYLALAGQIAKRLGAATMGGLIKPAHAPCPMTA